MNSLTSSPLSRISNSASRALLESIHSFSLGGGPNVGFQMAMVGDVDRAREQVLKVLGNIHVFPQSNRGLRRDIDQNVNVAVGAMVAARVRAEQRRMRDATRAQRDLVLPQFGDDFLAVHNGEIIMETTKITEALSAPRRPPRAAQDA